MADGITGWLDGLDLAKYAALFVDNEVGLSDLPHITDDDLKELGLPLGPRKRIAAAIAALGEAPAPEAVSSSQAERRLLTVVFCDLVGSTELSRALDPEDLRDVMRRYQDAVAGTITRYEGHVAKYLGDGVLAYFGWPQAHEDQANRAVRAGLESIQAVRNITLEDGASLDSRVGIATGQVVIGDIVGDSSSQSEAVVGETPNLAARLQGVAAPGQVVIGAQTAQLIGSAFELDDLGSQSLKGFAEPVAAWQVIGERLAESRFASTHSQDDGVFVGREDEQQQLTRRWELAAGGDGQVVLISGEPGIGKSRICENFLQSLDNASVVLLRYQCAPLHTKSAYYPFVQGLMRAADLKVGDTPEAALDKLQAVFSQIEDGPGEIDSTLAAMMSIPLQSADAEIERSPQERKQEIFDLLFAQLGALTSVHPVLLIMEDLHWIDPSSHDLVDQTIRHIGELPVMMLLTHRPDFEAPWVGEANVANVTLNRLDAKQSRALAGEVAGTPLDPNLMDQIVARSDGVPLFLEELTKSLAEAQAGGVTLDETMIPATLQGILSERLDRLGQAREIAQIGAVIGRSFSYRLLAATDLVAGVQLTSGLDDLETAALIYRRGTVPDAEYTFKHALIQDAAYESLLRRRRRELHGTIAETLVHRLPESVEQEPQVVAHHFAEAGKDIKAAEFYYKAAQRAQRQSALTEAMSQYAQAIALIQRAPDREKHAQTELDCHLVLGPLLLFMNGPHDSDLADYYERAVELSDKVGDDRKSYSVKWGKWYVEHFGASNMAAASKTADELIELGLRQNDTGLLLQAHHSGWTSGMGRDDLSATLEHVEAGIRLYNADEHKHQIATYGGHDAGACCRWVGGMLYCIAGRLDRGAQLAVEAVTTAEYVAHDFTEVIARALGTTVQFLRRDEDKLVSWIEELEGRLGEWEGLYVHFVTTPLMLKGWAYVRSGQVDEGFELLEDNLAAIRKSGFPRISFQLCIMADATRQAGDAAKALSLITEALEVSETTGEKLWLAECHRIKGEILLDLDDDEAAEREFQQALAVAKNQGAGLFELRAAKNLAALMQQRGAVSEARDLLAPVYARFDEGLDTFDLSEAQALLATLT